MRFRFFSTRRISTTTGETFGAALKNGVGNVVRTILKLRDYRNVALFLVARMLYADGKTAILIFSGVYASGTMDWNLVEMLAYGIILTIFAIAGGLGAGLLDHAVGVKRAVAIEIGVTMLCLIAMVSMAPTSIFFMPVEPGVAVWDSPIFSTAPELAYLGFAILIAISITAAYASSRSLMARLAPAGMEGRGVRALCARGSATAWLAPGLVAYFTSTTQSLRAGFASIAILLMAGFLLLLFVKPPRAGRMTPEFVQQLLAREVVRDFLRFAAVGAVATARALRGDDRADGAGRRWTRWRRPCAASRWARW